MKKMLNYLFVILFIVVIAYLFSPDSEYTNKLWVLKGLSLAQPYKAAVSEYIQITKSLPLPGDLAREKILVKVSFDNTAVKAITVGEEGPGLVTVHYSTAGLDSAPAEINDKTITLIPELTSNKLIWSCKSTIPPDFLPRTCK